MKTYNKCIVNEFRKGIKGTFYFFVRYLLQM